MCGIVGIVSPNPVRETATLDAMRDTLVHRGPDHAGSWWSPDRRVGLGHRRLAIIDLSPLGQQPMRDVAGELCIVFNGEIYNHQDLRRELEDQGYAFRSSSDTEVILGAYRRWGTDCLQRLNGMFALALYDLRERRVLLARDRAGEKPLFYRLSDGGLQFASELKALMAAPDFPRRLDPEALDCYLALGYVPGDRCILRGVSKLPPAHALSFHLDSGNSRVWRYWRLPAPPGPLNGENGTDGMELVNELEDLIQDSVRRQLVADVPIGVMLSGGVDSSLVTAMAARTSAKIKTFTICFPGYGAYDEAEHARLIADHFGTDHVELEAEPSTVELMPVLARQFDEPMVDSSMIPTFLVSELIRRHCTVALGGDGGDELFGGYNRYSRLLWMQKRLAWIPQSVRRGIAGFSSRLLPVGTRGRNVLEALGADFSLDVPWTVTCFDRTARQALLQDNAALLESCGFPSEAIRLARIPREGDLIDRATRMDFENYLVDDILVKVDRASMLTSLETRAPLLDYRIIEFAFGKVPWTKKAAGTNRKILLKKLAARVLPPRFDHRRKRGFCIPLESWLKDGPWREFFRDVLLGRTDSLFDRDAASELLEGQRRGRLNGERLFALVLFELWRREYAVSL